jgi:hypothetical protein
MDAALEAKLRDIADRDAIWQVMLAYARGLDRIDSELTRSCYFGDCIEDHSHYVGDVEGFIRYAEGVSRAYLSTQHALLNHVCELAGDDAYCETYFHFTGVSEPPVPHFMSVGRYVDHFQRRKGEWRIANRVAIVEGCFDVSDSVAARALPSAYKPGEIYPATRDRTDVSYHRPPKPRQPRS